MPLMVRAHADVRAQTSSLCDYGDSTVLPRSASVGTRLGA